MFNSLIILILACYSNYNNFYCCEATIYYWFAYLIGDWLNLQHLLQLKAISSLHIITERNSKNALKIGFAT